MKKTLYLIAPVLAGLIANASAAVVAQFDFNTETSTTQAGWIAAPLGNGTDGTYSLTTTSTAGLLTRDRGTNNGGGTEADMWRDLVLGGAAGGDTPTVTLTVSGLLADTVYTSTVWSYDVNSVGPNAQRAPRGFQLATNLETVDVTWPYNEETDRGSAPVPTSLADYAFVINGTTDGLGNLVITASELGGDFNTGDFNIFLNGLQIVPEPTTALLGCFGALLLLRRRR